MTFVCKHVAIVVHDLRAAEDFYRQVFGMELRFREVEDADGVWSTLPHELDWPEAVARGIEIDMVALRRDDFVLALFRGTPQGGTVVELGVGLSPSELDDVRERGRASVAQCEGDSTALRFEDPFGYRWNVQREDVRFRSSGEIAGRWLG